MFLNDFHLSEIIIFDMDNEPNMYNLHFSIAAVFGTFEALKLINSLRRDP